MGKKLIAVGLDVALASIGVAILIFDDDRITAKGLKSRTTEKSDGPLSGRLRGLGDFAADAIGWVLAKDRAGVPVRAGVEDFARGFPYMREEMGMSVGAVRALVHARHGLEIETVPPRMVKTIACPRWPGLSKVNWELAGRTTKFKASMPDKASVIAGLHSRFGIIARNEHEADAACVALAVARRAGIAVA